MLSLQSSSSLQTPSIKTVMSVASRKTFSPCPFSSLTFCSAVSLPLALQFLFNRLIVAMA